MYYWGWSSGISGTLYSLRNNFDNRHINIVGTDMDPDAIGKFLCDKFFVIPPTKNPEDYLIQLLKICKENSIDILMPQNTSELEILSQNKEKFNRINTKILLASEKAIEIANNKFTLMSKCKEIGVPVGEFFLVSKFDDLITKAKKLGWPNENIVVKPPISNGMRGVRIISESRNLKDSFYSEKPNSLYISMDSLKSTLGNNFPELIVTEFLPGDEYSVDVLRNSNRIIVIPRERNKVRSGITFHGTVIENEKIIEYCTLIAEKLDLKNCFGFQFKIDKNGIPKILESNPRIQGTMILSTLAGANIIYASIKMLYVKIMMNLILNGDKIY